MLWFLSLNIIQAYAELIWVTSNVDTNFEKLSQTLLKVVGQEVPPCSSSHGEPHPQGGRLHIIQLGVAGLKLVSETINQPYAHVATSDHQDSPKCLVHVQTSV